MKVQEDDSKEKEELDTAVIKEGRNMESIALVESNVMEVNFE